MIKKHYFVCILFLTLFIAIAGCKKSDDKNLPKITISRLYLSVSTTGPDSLLKNTLVFDPADEAPFALHPFLSEMVGSQGICLNDSSFRGYQVSARLRRVNMFNVDIKGSLTQSSFFVDSSLTTPRDIAYRRKDKLLFISNNKDNTIRTYYNPDTISGKKNKPTGKLKLTGTPQGICLDHDNLFIVISGGLNEILLAKIAKSDSLVFPLKSKINISGAVNLCGIFYSAKQDVLLVTDIGSETNANDGKIFIIADAAAKFAAGGLISPTRVISGPATLLGNPVDIDLDQREDKNLIYVAEKLNKKILVFKLGDVGDIAPTISQDVASSPESIYLDAR